MEKDYNYLIKLFNEWDINGKYSININKEFISILNANNAEIIVFDSNVCIYEAITWVTEQKPQQQIKLSITDNQLLEIVNNWSMCRVDILDIYEKFKHVKPV